MSVSNRLARVLGMLPWFFLCPHAVAGEQYKALDLYKLESHASGLAAGPSFRLPHAAAAGGVVGEGQVNGTPDYHAVFWTTSGAIVDLNPTSFMSSGALGTNGVQQVGDGALPGSHFIHALLWNGSAASAVDLNPTGFDSSGANATDGFHQVGDGGIAGTLPMVHAMLWSGTAASAVDLHPTKLPYVDRFSVAYGLGGNTQVGSAFDSASHQHAVLWHGTAESAVDLSPAGFSDSWAYGTSGDQQVGGGVTGTATHAMLWSGTAASVIDLHPRLLIYLTQSYANDTNGEQQVGYGVASTVAHALVWSGTPESAVDLDWYLPSGLTDSVAMTIDAAGDVFGLARDQSDEVHAIEWVPVPEPTALGLVIVGCGVRLGRQRTAGRSFAPSVQNAPADYHPPSVYSRTTV